MRRSIGAARLLGCLLPLAMGASAEAGETSESAVGGEVRVFTPPLRYPDLGFARTLRLYLPSGHDGPRRYPVIYMFDAQNLFDAATSYAGEWGVDESMDRLARESGFEAIVVGIDHGGSLRANELTPYWNLQLAPTKGAAFMRELVGTIKPFVDANFPTRSGRAATAVIGSSLGGLSADYAIHTHADVFGKAAALSPSFWVSEVPFLVAARDALPSDSRLYFSMGGREGRDAVLQVRRMARIVAGHDGAAVESHIDPEAEHNEAAWREEFPRAVRWLFELPTDAD